jgi:ATP-dependent DNA ligase
LPSSIFLKLNGEDQHDRPLVDRREALRELLSATPPNGIVFSEEIGGDGGFLKHVCEFGFEGIVSKLRISPYRSGRRTGAVGTGFNARTGVEAKKPPIAGLKVKGAVWTRPEIVVDVEYRGWTEDHQLRHPGSKAFAKIDRSTNFCEERPPMGATGLMPLNRRKGEPTDGPEINSGTRKRSKGNILVMTRFPLKGDQ